jgi:hypothetical protein
VTEQQPLKLIVAYDQNQNEYSVVAHNRQTEEAQAFLDQWTRHLREGHSFIVLDQTKRHATEEAQVCRACRTIAIRSGRLQPEAKFIRRKE